MRSNEFKGSPALILKESDNEYSEKKNARGITRETRRPRKLRIEF